jgi:hypothetical protein
VEVSGFLFIEISLGLLLENTKKINGLPGKLAVRRALLRAFTQVEESRHVEGIDKR